MSEKPNAHSTSIMSVAFSPDGSKIVSGSADKGLKVWDAGTLELVNADDGGACAIIHLGFHEDMGADQ